MFHDHQNMFMGRSGVFLENTVSKSVVEGKFTVGNKGLSYVYMSASVVIYEDIYHMSALACIDPHLPSIH